MTAQADDLFELELTAMAHGGSALGRHEGRTIFVPYTIPGERISARLSQDKGRFAYAESLKLITTLRAACRAALPALRAGALRGLPLAAHRLHRPG
jgi:tRNA/tmRNA/rRNA uracil-C5-methylase (TrmA/RlmC/RlmD family)